MPLEADFERHYRADLRRLCWGPNPTGVRRLLALIDGLPPDSAVHRAGADPDGHLAALPEHWPAFGLELIDARLRLIITTLAALGGVKEKDLPDFGEPLRLIPRPAAPAHEKRKSTSAEIAAFFGRG